MHSEDLSVIRVPGRVRPIGPGLAWSHFRFTPDDPKYPPFHVRVGPGAEAFVLRGILALDPAVPSVAEGIVGHPPVMIEVTPAFAEEEELSGQQGEHAQVPIHLRRLSFRFGDVAPAPPFPLPQANRNHHPVYCIFGVVMEPQGFVAAAETSARRPPIG